MNIRGYFNRQHIVSIALMVVTVNCLLVSGPVSDIFGLLDNIGVCFALLTSIAVTLRPKADKLYSAGLIGLGLGLMAIFKYMHLASAYDSFLMFAVGVVGTGLGIMTMVLAFPIYCGSRYDSKRMIIILAITLCTMFVPTVFMVAFGGDDLFQVLSAYSDEFLLLIPVVAYIWLLSDAEIGYKSIKKRFKDNIGALMTSNFCDDAAYIMRDDLLALTDESKWVTVNEGYIKNEIKVPLRVNHKKAVLVLQEWEDGTFWAMVLDSDEGTHIQTFRFPIYQWKYDGDISTSTYITVYGKEGFFMRLLIHDKSEKIIETNRFRRILYTILGCYQ